MSGNYLYPLKRVFLNLSGGTVTGDTTFTQGVSAIDLSGETIYLNGVSLVNTFLQINAAISSATTLVQGGLNTYTGGTVLSPTINISAATLAYLSATTISGNTLFSGSTDLYNIFQKIGTDISTAIQPGVNIQTGGTALIPIISVISSPSFDSFYSSGSSQLNTVSAISISGGTISGNTLFSGSTNLYDIFLTTASANDITRVQPGLNIYTGGTGNFPTLNISAATLVSLSSTTIMGLQFFVEGSGITFNYNSTGDTTATSIGAGYIIQDGSGVAGTDVFFDLRGTAIGVDNRSFSTNLNDIRIRESGTTSSPDGARVLAEYDFLDGGFY